MMLFQNQSGKTVGDGLGTPQLSGGVAVRLSARLGIACIRSVKN